MISRKWNLDTALSVTAEENRAKGRMEEALRNIRMLMKNTGATAERAMEMLGIERSAWGKYLTML